MCPLFSINFCRWLYARTWFYFSFSSNKLNLNLDYNLFGHGYLSNGFMKIDLDDVISSFLTWLLMKMFCLLNGIIGLDIYGKMQPICWLKKVLWGY